MEGLDRLTVYVYNRKLVSLTHHTSLYFNRPLNYNVLCCEPDLELPKQHAINSGQYTVKIRVSMQHPNFTMNAQGCSDYTHEKLKVL